MNYDISKKLKTKAKTEKEKETVKPTVINDILFRYTSTLLYGYLESTLLSTIRRTEFSTMTICPFGNSPISRSLTRVLHYLFQFLCRYY